MIKKNEIVSISIDKSFFLKGLDYALISWTSTFNRMGKPNPYVRLQKIILGIIAENAFEKFLIDNKINYETNGKTKWYEVDRYDIGINDFAIDVKANFLDLKSTFIQNKLNNLFEDKAAWFLKCHALVPLDQFNPGTSERRVHKRNKVYVFPFIEGHFNENIDTGFLVHTFWDYKWLKRAEQKNLPNLGRLTIKYNGTLDNSYIKIYGTTSKNNVCIEQIKLTSSEIISKNDFFQVFSMEWIGISPDGILQVFSKVLNLKEVVKPNLSFSLEKTDDGYWPSENNWQSLAIHNCNVHLLGWIYEEEFRIIGKEYKRFTHTIEQYSETKVDNWGCFVRELEPIKNINKI